MRAEPPRRSRPAPRPGVVHLGLGAFFRAHGAMYLQEAMAEGGGNWGVVGVSLQRPDQRDRLKPQDCAFTAVEKGPQGDRLTTVESVVDVLVAPENPGAVLTAMAEPAIRIVSLTVTEKGYRHVPATGALNRDDPDVAHDVAHPEAPRTAPGILAAALARRRAAGLRPFTVLSCDNLPDNGATVRGVVLALAEAQDAARGRARGFGLADWIAAEGAFPATMVDRIVPATRPDDVAALAALGVADAAPVIHEPFRQWVVEDRFVDDARPDLAAVGVQLTGDVAPWERMKLRMLNGAHSALAYIGGMAGLETVSAAATDPVLARFLDGFWAEEVIPTLAAPAGADRPADLAAYAAALRARFANPAIRHLTAQIAMDGSQKLPQRLMGTVRDLLAAGRPLDRVATATAAWMAHVAGPEAGPEAGPGAPMPVRDPLAQRLRALADPDPIAQTRALLGVGEVFGADLPAKPRFVAAVERAARRIAAEGALAAAAAVA